MHEKKKKRYIKSPGKRTFFFSVCCDCPAVLMLCNMEIEVWTPNLTKRKLQNIG
jgi:hypothetical protein